MSTVTWWRAGVVGVMAASMCSAILGQERGSRSGPLAVELSQLMAAQQLEAIAAKDSIDDDRFVAALAFPGQLLVVSARYEVPVILTQKIQNGDYRDVYIDLNAASIAGSKVLITDTGADGLHAEGATVDVVSTDASTLRLDGNRSGGQMSSEQYGEAAREADEQYARMLRALVSQAR